ncbi:hypothetical protein ACMD2_13915, partial [Ananas comosus]
CADAGSHAILISKSSLQSHGCVSFQISGLYGSQFLSMVLLAFTLSISLVLHHTLLSSLLPLLLLLLHSLPPKQHLHVLQAPSPRLRQEDVKEHPTHRRDPRVEEEAPGDGDGVVERDEGHGYHPAHDPVHGRPHAGSLRPQPQREYLRAVHPRDRPQPDRERPHEAEHRRNRHRSSSTPVTVAVVVGAIVNNAEGGGEGEEGGDHAAGAGEEERAAADAVEEEGGDEDEGCLGEADGDGGTEGVGVGADAGLLEHARAVQHHRVDARRLLEELQPEGRQQDPPHRRRRPHQQLPPHPLPAPALRVLAQALFYLLSLGLVGAAGGLGEHAARIVEAALHDEPAGGLRHGEHSGAEEDGRDGAGEEHGAPAEAEGQLREGEVGHVPEEDAGVDEHLREGRERAARRRGGELGRIHGRDHQRVPDADPRHEAADHQHGVVRGEAHRQRPREEDGGRQHHGVAPPDPVRGAARRQRPQQRVQVDDPRQYLDLRVRHPQVLLDEELRPAHHRDPMRMVVMEASMAQARAYLFRLGLISKLAMDGAVLFGGVEVVLVVVVLSCVVGFCSSIVFGRRGER